LSFWETKEKGTSSSAIYPIFKIKLFKYRLLMTRVGIY
jgi:hypothetical protein